MGGDTTQAMVEVKDIIFHNRSNLCEAQHPFDFTISYKFSSERLQAVKQLEAKAGTGNDAHGGSTAKTPSFCWRVKVRFFADARGCL